ncbi:MAG: glycosyltransferase [Desulfotomaculum sp.]|nr:glycosyltransferase [Desulfotomaculum sp.]
MWLRKKYQIPSESKVLLFVGRLGKEKNIDFLLDMHEVIIKSNYNAVLVIVGDGPYKQELKNKVYHKGLGNKVIFTGLLSKFDTIKCYAGADLFVFASVTETQGLVIGEAKAAGLPVIAVDAFGVSDMIVHGEDGYLSPLDLGRFISYVKEVLSNKELYSKMKQSAVKNAQKMSSHNCAQKLLDVYRLVFSECNSVRKISV